MTRQGAALGCGYCSSAHPRLRLHRTRWMDDACWPFLCFLRNLHCSYRNSSCGSLNLFGAPSTSVASTSQTKCSKRIARARWFWVIDVNRRQNPVKVLWLWRTSFALGANRSSPACQMCSSRRIFIVTPEMEFVPGQSNSQPVVTLDY